MTSSERALRALHALLGVGVRDVVLSPGSRSAPLALAVWAADEAGDLRLHVRHDERTAGFLALGLATGSGRPVAVVTTSGTAVGNLLPAVMEAAHRPLPLVVVSADRPAALRGTGANQTTWQAGIYGRFARTIDVATTASAADLAAAARQAAAGPGPGHLNVQFEPPLLPAGPPWWSSPDLTAHAPVAARQPAAGSEPPLLPAGPRTVVVAGDGAGAEARLLAEAAGYPLFAEPTSGCRTGEIALRCYRLLLRTRLRAEIERVVVVGHPTLSRPVTELLGDPRLTVLAVTDAAGIATDPGRVATHLSAVPSATPPSGADLAWLAQWQSADIELGSRLDRFVDGLPELDPLQVAAGVTTALPADGALVVGSSHPVRDLELARVPPVGRSGVVVGNRGLAGIDGTVSTALGVALTRPTPTLALLGDVTFLHDAGGLLLGPQEPRPDLTLVVVNDDGGSIFAVLEQGAGAYAAAFERVFATPHHADLAALCAAGGTPHTAVTTRAQLTAALQQRRPGVHVVEARVGRTQRRDVAAHLLDLAQEVVS